MLTIHPVDANLFINDLKNFLDFFFEKPIKFLNEGTQ